MENQFYKLASAQYPSECCGMILESKHKKGSLRLRPCVNAQDKYHREDPQNFPRDSKTAYFIEPAELFQIEKELRENGERIAFIYHSHPDADAYFSDEDIARAAPDGEPLFPDTDYLVISVRGGQVVNHKTFHWDAKQASFVEKL